MKYMFVYSLTDDGLLVQKHVLANPVIVYWSKDIYDLNNKVLILNSTVCLTILCTLTSLSNKTSSALVHNKFTNKHTTWRLLTKLL